MKQRRGESGDVSFGLLAGGLVLAMVVVGAIVVRTQGNDKATTGAATTVLASTVLDTTPNLAQLAPTTLLADPAAALATASAVESGSGDSGRDATVTTLATTPANSTTGLATPQAAARNLWDAWRDLDQPRALLYASPKVVSLVFATAWSPQIRQAGCTQIESGWLCRFEGRKTRWDFDIEGDEVQGYRIRTASTGEAVGDLVFSGTLPSASSLPSPVQTRADGTPLGPLGPSIPTVTTLTTEPGAPVPDGLPTSLGEILTESDGLSTTTVPTTVKAAKRKKSTKSAISVSTVKTSRAPVTRVVPEPDPPAEPAADPTPEPDLPAATSAGNGSPKPVPVANPE